MATQRASTKEKKTNVISFMFTTGGFGQQAQNIIRVAKTLSVGMVLNIISTEGKRKI